MSVLCPLPCPDYLRSAEMTEVMMSTPAMDEIGLSPRKDGLSYQIPFSSQRAKCLQADVLTSKPFSTEQFIFLHLGSEAALSLLKVVEVNGEIDIFPDPSDFDCYCKLKDRLPSIVVEPTEGDVESGELRWPPEEFLVQEEEEEESCEDAKEDNKEQ
ncbi:hypothetical protein CIB84_003049 [Bambusicola thoracicus]|uniref:LBH domain-containing protein n=1 Tax=Bambusicola thoracicus TaxID=9083 RepID=A0A2P4TA19_BAMTH|nr:hypothetical protein CIB84_003049 [Bambusicola thoracicus]